MCDYGKYVDNNNKLRTLRTMDSLNDIENYQGFVKKLRIELD